MSDTITEPTQDHQDHLEPRPVEFIHFRDQSDRERYKRISRELLNFYDNNVALTDQNAALLEENSGLKEDLEVANTNAISGLPNKRVLNKELKKSVEKASQEENSDMSVVSLDLDGFKETNDTHGHAMGDRVLYYMGMLLRKEDIVAMHPGGDEFVIVIPKLRREGNDEGFELDELQKRASEKFRFVAELAAKLAGVPGSASVGIATYEPGDTPESMLKRSDVAMYADKEGKAERLARVKS